MVIRPGDRVVVVGAGMAGLMAAGLLATRFEVLVLDKARGVGGRMATRRIGAATLDHGAQFLTTHTEQFAGILAGWEAQGVVAPWFSGRVGPDGIGDADGHVRYRGANTMNDIAKLLALPLDVRRSDRVSALQQVGPRWRVRAERGDVEADAVVLTAPVPQSTAVLGEGGVALGASDLEALGSVHYEPCLAVLVPLRGPSGLPEPGAVDPDRGPIDWMADNQLKGVSASPAVTIHADPGASRRLWDAEDAEVCRELTGAAGLASAASEQEWQVQRWRYAKPVRTLPQRCRVVGGTPPLVLAGDAFGGPRVEGAALSGVAAAEALLAMLPPAAT